MNYSYCAGAMDNGGTPYVADVLHMAEQNPNFRTAIWTGEHLQMTLMCIPPCGEIGLEIHEETEQFIRVEEGNAVVELGRCKNQVDIQHNICKGDVVFVPAGTWHNVINTSRNPLKLSSIYGPPNHRKGTVHRTKAEAEGEQNETNITYNAMLY